MNLPNYTFGQSSLQSLYRFFPEDCDDSLLLERLTKIATRQIGQLLGLSNCTWYECVMKGVNTIAQVDAHPCYMCPVCYRKMFKCLKFDHVKRYKDLIQVCEFTQAKEYEKYEKSYKDWFISRYEYVSNSKYVAKSPTKSDI